MRPERAVWIIRALLVEYLAHGGDVVYRHACRLGCEGIVSKRLDSPYVSGRTRRWLKFKNPAAPGAPFGLIGPGPLWRPRRTIDCTDVAPPAA